MYVIAISALSLSAHFFLNASCALNEGLLYLDQFSLERQETRNEDLHIRISAGRI